MHLSAAALRKIGKAPGVLGQLLIAACVLLVVAPVVAFAQQGARPTKWNVDGVEREAILVAPSKPTEGGAPVVFAFHGHGGTMRNASRNFRYHEHWPEAIVV